MTSGWQLQLPGRSRHHMLECWLDSFRAPETRGLPSCHVRDAFVEGRAVEWAVYVSEAD